MSAIVPSETKRVVRPAEPSRELMTLVSRFMNRLEETGDIRRRCISAKSLPTESERSVLEGRRAELNTSLAPDHEAARKTLLALLGSFPSYGEDEETGRFILSACCRACASVPTWALNEASGRFLENRARIPWNMANRPTPPQILAEARICMIPVEEELFRIAQVLDAEVVDIATTQAERDEAIAKWEAVKAGIGRSNVLHERTPDDITKERSEQQRANAVVREREARAQTRLDREATDTPIRSETREDVA